MTAGVPHRLVLLRHAKAEPAGSVVDELRPLALRGRRQSMDVGARLAADGLVPERVLVSSAVRTRQTWELVQGALGDVPEPDVEVTDALYEAGVPEVLDLVSRVDPRVRTLLVVGHEPTMSSAATRLAGEGTDGRLVAHVRSGLPTAAYAIVDLASWSDVSGARLVDVVQPAR